MDTGSTYVDALRLGLNPASVRRLIVPVTLEPETLVIRAAVEGECPLLLCLHPPRLSEFQFALKVRNLATLRAHLVFPRGLHPHLVDLGGARTVGYDWCHYTGDNPSFRDSLALATDYLDRVLNDVLGRLPVDRRSVFLLGAEGGALFASIYGVAHSDIFAGIITMDGHLLPEVIAEVLPEQRRVPFLCMNTRRRGRSRPREEIFPSGPRVDDLRNLGFPVTHELMRGDCPPWQEEEAILISWLTQKAGVEVLEASAP